MNFNPRLTWDSSFDDIAIGARVEIRHEGRLARRLDLWWLAGEYQRGPHPWRHRVEYEDIPLLTEATEDGTWEMIVRGEPHLALRAGPAGRYWAGEFRLPLVILPGRNGPIAPPLDWTEE